MKLYAEYIKEREGLEIVSDEHCFLTYKRDGEDIVVYDIYSDKEVRGTGYMLDFCDGFYSTMKSEGVNNAYGMTDIKTNGWQNSERLLLKYGFKFIGTDPENKNIRNYYYEIGEK